MTQLTVVPQSLPTTVVTLVKAGTLKNRLTKLNSNSKATTLSLAYYTMLNGNVNPMSSCDNSLPTLLDPKYRHMVCAKWNKTDEKWEYNKPKATKLLNTMGLTFNVSSFEDFVKAVDAHQDTINAKKADKEAQENALTPEEQVQGRKDKVLAYLVKCGLTEVQLRDLVHSVEQERSRKNVVAPVMKLAVGEEPNF